MGFWRWTICMAAMAGLAGCSIPSPDPRLESAARGVFDAVRHGDDAYLHAHAAPGLYTPSAQGEIDRLRGYLPKREPGGSKVVGWTLTTVSGQGDTGVVNEEFDYGDRQAQFLTRLVRPDAGQPWAVQGFHLQVATTQELAVNDFTVNGRSPLQYLFLAAAIASPLAMIWALVKVVRRRGLKRKWLWGILAFAGLFSLQMVWSTGNVSINWLTVQLLDAGMTRGASRFDPWVITMTLPVGAFLILTGLWANPARAKTPPAPPPEASPTA